MPFVEDRDSFISSEGVCTPKSHKVHVFIIKKIIRSEFHFTNSVTIVLRTGSLHDEVL